MTSPRRREAGPITAISPWWMLTNSPFFLLFWIAIGWIVLVSLFTPSLIALYQPTVTFGNFARVFTDSTYVGVLFDTVWMALVGSALSVVVGYPLALRVSRSRGAVRSLYMGVVVTVLLVAFIVKLYAWQILLAESSPLSGLLAAFGAPPSLLGTKSGVILGLTYASLPYTVLSLIASVDQVPPAVEEAAAIYGAGPVRRFFTVILPMTSPGMATALIFAIPLNLSAFLAPLLLGRGMVQMTALQIYTSSASGGTGSNWPLAAALSVTLMVVCIVFTVISLRLVQRNVTKGVA
ncbi:MAG: ABC transporter permease [Bifidobacteriaceae bacterium]|jgi:ABC-type spermidine/putrescine transport system permease subunit I|nr:ABC transporter permease [Bifidobacteriaceae bacterium]